MQVWKMVCFWMLAQMATPSGRLELVITDIIKGQGCLRLGIYESADAFNQKDLGGQYGREICDLTDTQQIIHIANLPPGEYALALYQDLNDNGQLDTNLFGIPTEPYAFSRNPGVKWRSPTFSETAFRLDAQGHREVLSLRRWKNH